MAQRPIGVLLFLMSFWCAGTTAFAAGSSLRSPIVKTNRSSGKAQAIPKPAMLKPFAVASLEAKPSNRRASTPVVVAQVSVVAVKSPETMGTAMQSTSQRPMVATSFEKTMDKAEAKAVSGILNLSYSQSMVDHLDGTKTQSTAAILVLSGPLSTNWALTGKIIADKNLKDETNEDVTDGISDLNLLLSNKDRDLAPWLSGSLIFTGVIPMSENSSKVTGLQVGLGTRYKFALTPVVLPKGLDTSLTLGVSRSFHKYETGADDQVLNPWGVQEILVISYEFNKWLLSFEGVHRHLWSYQDSVGQNFEHSEELGYSILPKWKVAIGHTNAGSWLKANSQDMNLGLINENDSIVYGSTELAF